MSQPQLSHNLDKIIQLISIEQLLGLAKQLKIDNSISNISSNISSNNVINDNDVLSSPIVKNMISSYENELQTLRTSSTANISNNNNNNNNNNKCCECDIVNSSIISEIQKIGSQLENIHNNIAIIVDKINTLEIKQNILARQDEEHIKLTIEEKITSNNSKIAEHVVTDAIAAVISEAMDDEEVLEEEEDEEVLEEEEDEEVLEDEVASLESEKEVANLEAEEVASLEEEVLEEEVLEEEVLEEEVLEEEVLEEAEEEEVLEEEVASLEAEDDDSLTEPEISDDSDSEIKEVISEAVVVSAAVVSAAVVNLEEDEEEVFEIEIDDITYFATDEENGILYEVDKDGDVGKKVGIIKNGEPIFS
jgi:hypothetical protein